MTYRKLALATLVSTFALIVLGGVVRVSDSGLGCGPAGSGFNGWPLCDGDVIPGLDLHSVIEFAHRVLAVAVGFMIIALAVQAWRRHRDDPAILRPAIAAVPLVGIQGLLGRYTVEENLEEGWVAAHLGLAMVMLAVLLYLWRATRPEARSEPAAEGGPRLRVLAVLASGAIFATIVAGGLMAGTQNYGRPDYQLGDGAHHACGKEFPTCNGEFLPFGEARLVDIHLTHRVLMYLATALVLWLVVLALRRRPSRRVVGLAWAALALLVVQVAVGALNVWLDEYEALILLHLSLGTLLWGTLSALTMELYPLPARTPGRLRGPQTAEARG